MKNIIIFTVISLLFLTGCGQFMFYPQTGSTTFPPTIPETIELYSGDIEEEYIVIGSVAADMGSDAKKVSEFLKKRAAEIGADAIIHVNLSKVAVLTTRTTISGVAVKLK